MKKQLLALTAAAALLTAASSSFAGSMPATSDLSYQIELLGGCTFLTTNGLTDFGVYAVDSNNLLDVAAGSITINCPGTLPYAIMIDGGDQPTGATATDRRQMVGSLGTANVQYDLKEAVSGFLVGDNNSLDDAYTQTIDLPGITGTGNDANQTYNLLANVYISSAVGVQDTFKDSKVIVTATW